MNNKQLKEIRELLLKALEVQLGESESVSAAVMALAHKVLTDNGLTMNNQTDPDYQSPIELPEDIPETSTEFETLLTRR